MATGRMEFYADSVQAHTNFCFILPNDLNEADIMDNPYYGRKTKTMLLLHGFTGTDTDWLYGGVAQQIAWQYNLAIITPTTGNNFYVNRSWKGGKYADYIGIELPEYLNRIFGLSIDKEDLLIGGFSMGGFGALHTLLAYPERYGGAIALSSAYILDEVRELKPGSHDLIAEYGYYKEVFGDVDQPENTDLNLEKILKNDLSVGKEVGPVYMAIGTEDALYGENQKMKRMLEQSGILLRYEDGPGKHDWIFWNKYVLNGVEWLLEHVQ